MCAVSSQPTLSMTSNSADEADTRVAIACRCVAVREVGRRGEALAYSLVDCGSDDVTQTVVSPDCERTVDEADGGAFRHEDMTINTCEIDDVMQVAVSEFAMLKYIDVKICDIDNTVSALIDGGSEICVARTDVLSQLESQTVGKLRLRGIVGSPVDADLVYITNITWIKL